MVEIDNPYVPIEDNRTPHRPAGAKAALALAEEFAAQIGNPPPPLADEGGLSGLDYSLESLTKVDRYLARVHDTLAAGESWTSGHIGLAIRAGCYLGETIRREAAAAFAWYDDREALEAFPDEFEAEADGMLPLGEAFLLRSEDAFWFPVAEVVRALREGPMSSVETFAEVAIHPHHHGVMTGMPGRTHVILTPASFPES